MRDISSPLDGFSSPFGPQRNRTLQSLLFGQTEPGFTFEPWDVTALFQDRAGTTPVTAAGQSVGLRLDKSQGLRQGPELVTNGSNEAGVAVAPLDTLTNFTAKVQSADRAQSGGYSAKLTANSTSGSHYWNLTNVAAGVTVQISGWVYVPTGATAGQSIKLVDIFDGSFTPTVAAVFDQWVYFSAIRPAKATAWALALGQDVAANWAGGSIYVDGLSIKTLAGNHEVAVSDAKRGVYGWMPKTGKRNLLTYTEQFNNAVWTKTNTTVTADATAAPDGTNTADKLSETATTASHYAYETYTSTGVRIVYSVYAKAAERRRIAVWEGTTSANGAVFDLISGTVVNNLAAGVGSIESVGDGWYRCSVTSIETAGTRWLVCSVLLDDATGVGGTVGVAGSGIYVWGAQLEVGSTATAYQRVVSQYDITEAGVPTCYYVQADGVDDAYVTPTITPNTDKVQVFAGVRKLSETGVGTFVEFSTAGDVNNGAFYLRAPWEGVASYDWNSQGTLNSRVGSSGQTAPITNVITGLGDISGDTATLRINGTQVAQSTIDQGTGNYLAYPAYIYSRGGTSLPFNGLDFGHAVRFGPNLDAATIARVESLIARNTPEVTL